jgi:hypothetical protein
MGTLIPFDSACIRPPARKPRQVDVISATPSSRTLGGSLTAMSCCSPEQQQHESRHRPRFTREQQRRSGPYPWHAPEIRRARATVGTGPPGRAATDLLAALRRATAGTLNCPYDCEGGWDKPQSRIGQVPSAPIRSAATAPVMRANTDVSFGMRLGPQIFSRRRSVRQLRSPPVERDDPPRELERASIERLSELGDSHEILS